MEMGLWWRPLRFGVRSKHLGNMNSFNHKSAVFSSKTDRRAADIGHMQMQA